MALVRAKAKKTKTKFNWKEFKQQKVLMNTQKIHQQQQNLSQQ